jgi:hypothetical protein
MRRRMILFLRFGLAIAAALIMSMAGREAFASSFNNGDPCTNDSCPTGGEAACDTCCRDTGVYTGGTCTMSGICICTT